MSRVLAGAGEIAFDDQGQGLAETFIDAPWRDFSWAAGGLGLGPGEFGEPEKKRPGKLHDLLALPGAQRGEPSDNGGVCLREKRVYPCTERFTGRAGFLRKPAEQPDEAPGSGTIFQGISNGARHLGGIHRIGEFVDLCADVVEETFNRIGQKRPQDRTFVVEIEIDRALGQARAPREGTDGKIPGRVDVGQLLRCRAEDQAPSLVLLFRAVRTFVSGAKFFTDHARKLLPPSPLVDGKPC
jgi:hypothetical protein